MLKAESRRASLRPGVSGAQRRQVTVLFCDLASSAELASRIDPEDMRDVLHAYLNAFAARIESAGGFIARYMGDGLMAYFGYPLTREGDPARAVRAALEVIDTARTLDPPHGHRLSVRCGIATGLAVIGDLVGKGAASERGVVGSAPNLAARLQAEATPGEVVIDAMTARLTGRQLITRELGPLTLKGFVAPEHAYAVNGVRSGGSHSSQRGAGDLPPMIGRAREAARLEAAWRRALAGKTTVVSVIGEPGLGKSRLIEEFRHALAAQSHNWFQAGGDPTLQGQAYGVASRIVRARLPANANDSPSLFARELERAGLPPDRAALLMRTLGGDIPPEDANSSPLDAEDRRRSLNTLLVDWTIARARRKPTVIAIEDLHWADPSSVEVLGEVIAARPDVPLLIVTTSRDDVSAVRRVSTALQYIRLQRLTDAEIALVATNAADRPMTETRLSSIVARAEGNPLFAEELTAHLGDDPRRTGAIPETLTGLLTARLDATGPAAGLARIAAALGREFNAALLARVARSSTHTVNAALEALTHAGLLTRDGEIYSFRHALIREAAYASLVKADRHTLHRRAAQMLSRSSSAPHLAIARHWREAGEMRRAVDAYRDTARSYTAESSHAEAAQAYRAALDILADLPPSQARDREEMDLLSALANALQITDGYAAPAPSEVAARARSLAERIGDSAKMFTQLSAAWMAASSAGDYRFARELVGRAMPLAQAVGTPETLGTAYMMQMTTAYRVGALAEGEAAFRSGASVFRNPAFTRRPGAVPQVFGNAAVNAWLIGLASPARQRTARVLSHRVRDATPYARAFSGYMAAMQLVLMEDAEGAADLARDAMIVSDTEGFPQFSATSRIVLGRALVMSGQRRKGIDLMTDGLARMEANGSRNGMTMYLTWLAQSHLEGRGKEIARVLCEKALTLNPSERFYRPETLRISGLAHNARSAADARRMLRDAVDMAEAIGSPWQSERARAALVTIRRPV